MPKQYPLAALLVTLVIALAGCPPVSQGTPPTAAFTADPLEGEVPLFVQFTDHSLAGSSVITDWDWDFGDNGTSSLTDGEHVFTEPGTYSVSLTVTSAAGTDTHVENDLIAVAEAGGEFTLTLNNTGGGVNITQVRARIAQQDDYGPNLLSIDLQPGNSTTLQLPAPLPATNEGGLSYRILVIHGPLGLEDQAFLTRVHAGDTFTWNWEPGNSPTETLE